jgi:hypothetical protein
VAAGEELLWYYGDAYNSENLATSDSVDNNTDPLFDYEITSVGDPVSTEDEVDELEVIENIYFRSWSDENLPLESNFEVPFDDTFLNGVNLEVTALNNTESDTSSDTSTDTSSDTPTDTSTDILWNFVTETSEENDDQFLDSELKLST